MFTIDAAARCVFQQDTAIDLEAKVFDLILLLLENRQRAMGKQEIVEALWGTRPVTDAALSQLVYKARRVFGDDGTHQAVIRTVYGHGLQWVAALEPAGADAEDDSVDVRPETTPSARHVAPDTRRRAHWVGVGAIAAITVIALVFAVVWYPHARSSTSSAHPPVVAVMPLQNDTGDKSLAWTVDGLPGLIGTLLERHGDLLAVDQHAVAEVSAFDASTGKARAQRVRQATGAAILLLPALHKLDANLYQLHVRIERGAGRAPHAVVVDGADPARLAVQAVARIRTWLGLASAARPALHQQPDDPYLAETFARGMAAMAQGRMADAKPYFEVCVSKDPDFLPCRFELGIAQTNTDEVKQALDTERAVLQAARSRHDAAMAANSLVALARAMTVQRQPAAALPYLKQARPWAKQAGDVVLQAHIALKEAGLHAKLRHTQLAGKALARARGLITSHHLGHLKYDVFNTAGIVAAARHDHRAAEKAFRAAIDAAVTTRDQRSAVANLYNVGYVVAGQGKPAEALAPLLTARERAKALGDNGLSFVASFGAANALMSVGLTRRAAPVVTDLVAMAKRQKLQAWLARALLTRSVYQSLTHKSGAALASARKAASLMDVTKRPQIWLVAQGVVALLALPNEPGAVEALGRKVDHLFAHPEGGHDTVYYRAQIDALAAAARHDAPAAHAALKQMATFPATGSQRSNFRLTGLRIALVNDDAEAARIVFAHFDPGTSPSVFQLRWVRQWAERSGDRALVKEVGQRRKALKTNALQALAHAGLGAPAP